MQRSLAEHPKCSPGRQAACEMPAIARSKHDDVRAQATCGTLRLADRRRRLSRRTVLASHSGRPMYASERRAAGGKTVHAAPTASPLSSGAAGTWICTAKRIPQRRKSRASGRAPTAVRQPQRSRAKGMAPSHTQASAKRQRPAGGWISHIDADRPANEVVEAHVERAPTDKDQRALRCAERRQRPQHLQQSTSESVFALATSARVGTAL